MFSMKATFCMLVCALSIASASAQVNDSIVYPEVLVEDRQVPHAIGSSISETDSLQYRLLAPMGLSQVLEAEPWISTRSYQPGGNANFSIRGTGSQHTQVVWDGIPINDPMLGLTDLSTVSLAGISGVRILYGPAGITNNSGSMGGTVELLSAPFRKKKGFDARAELTAGSYGRYGASVRIREKIGKFRDVTSVEFRTARNNFRFIDISQIDRPERRLEHARVRMIGANKKVGLQINEHHEVQANIYFSQAERELPPTMLTNSTQEKLLDRDIWAALRWIRKGTRSELRFTTSYIYGKQQYEDNNGYTFHHLYQANKNLVRYRLRLPHHLELNAGADVFFEHARSDSAYRNAPKTRYWQALFASLKYVPKRWVSAQFLVREDVLDGVFSPVQGLVGVELNPLRWMTIRGNVARNFRAPTLNDLYWVPGGNPDLQSETGFSWEGGLDLKHRTERWTLDLSATYFRMQMDNWIIWLPEGNLWSPQNKRAVVSQGAELQVGVGFNYRKFRADLSGGYTYVASIVREGSTPNDAAIGNQLIYVPPHQGRAALTVGFEELFLSYAHQYVGKRFTTSDNGQELPAYQLADVSIGYAHVFGKHRFGLGLTIENLFNTGYQMIAWRPMPGRAFLINLNYQFN